MVYVFKSWIWGQGLFEGADNKKWQYTYSNQIYLHPVQSKYLNQLYLVQDYSTIANIKTVKVVVKHVPDYSASREKNDLGFLTFDLQADLVRL